MDKPIESKKVSYYNIFMISDQIFKSIYFPDYKKANPKARGLVLAFSQRNEDLYRNVANLKSDEIRKLLGTSSYRELEQRAQEEGLPVNTYCLWYLRKNFNIKKSEIKSNKEYKVLPLNKIILGDALEKLKKIPKESFDIIIADPPYNIGKDFGNNIDKRELGEYIEWSKRWMNESVRILKPTGTIFIYGFSEILAYLSIEIQINKRWLIWHYTNKNVASLNFWQRSHEAIICAWKDKPIFNRDEIREPYTEGFLNGAAGKIRKGTLGRFSRNGKETVYKAHEGGALPRDVIKIPALAGGAGMIERWFFCKTCNNVFEPKKLKEHLKHGVVKHPTQKPVELTRKLIRSAMPKKEGTILIPFVGSGSECVVAKELGLSYLGFELNPEYIRIAEEWIMHTPHTPRLF